MGTISFKEKHLHDLIEAAVYLHANPADYDFPENELKRSQALANLVLYFAKQLANVASNPPIKPSLAQEDHGYGI